METLDKSILYSRKIFEDACSGGAAIVTAPWGEALCKIFGDKFLFIDTKDESLAPNLIHDGYWESWISVAMGREIQEGARCIDIGANFGYFTMLMALLAGENGLVLACEPIVDYSHLIAKSATMNEINTVEICHSAISNVAEEIVELRSPGKNTGSTSMVLWNHPLVAEYYDSTGFKTITNTIDNLVSTWDRVDIVKIDVEGVEDLVWYGMKETVRKNHNIAIFMEYSSFRYEDESLLDDIENEGFQLAIVNGDCQIQRISRGWLRGRELEMLALRRDFGYWQAWEGGQM